MAYVKPCLSKFQIEEESPTNLQNENQFSRDTNLQSIIISFEDAFKNRKYEVTELTNVSLNNPTSIGYFIQFQCSEVIESS
jgi:hypothetical protein